MRDKFAPPRELWDAAKCARVLNLKNAAAFLYRVNKGVFPAPYCYECGKAWWSAEQVREATRSKE